MSTTAPATLAMVTIDCADPATEAAFWAAALGWDVLDADGDYGMVGDGTQRLGFGRVEGWKAMLDLGATRPDEQPSESWVVLRDPDGHPFCLTQAENW